jgi:NitT/TauT family transport system substrate-binding protein
MRRFPAALLLSLGLALTSCGGDGPPAAGGAAAAAEAVLRFGHFPNVTHAHGVVAHALSRQGRGWFEERLGADVKVEWYTFNAGPGAMEALLAGTLDVTYVGPSPALNAHSRSGGQEVRVVAGATRGGAALVVPGDGRLSKPEQFRGKKVATPQLGNTQDVSCRAWLIGNGLNVTQTGGDAMVLPTHNPDQLALFQKGELDAVWTVEPWVSRLEMEAGGKVLVDEKDALTTVLVASAAFLKDRPDLARKVLAAHRDLTAWLGKEAAKAKDLVQAELKEETTRAMPEGLLDLCWGRMRFDDAVSRADFDSFASSAVKAGLLAEAPDTSRLVEVPK